MPECVRLFIGTEARAVWGPDIETMDGRLLKSVDCLHFDYLARVHAGRLRKGDARRAAIAIRVTYGMALETLMAYLAAFVQAPDAIAAWMTFYEPRDLVEVVSAMQGKSEVPIRWQTHPTWKDLARFVFPGVNASEQEATGNSWKQLAADFLDSRQRDEFNSAKHGMRLSSGGFYFALEPLQGGPPQPIRTSKFGSSFTVKGKVPEAAIDRTVSTLSLNWNPWTFVARIRLITSSLSAVVAALSAVDEDQPVPNSTPPSQRVRRKAYGQPTSLSLRYEVEPEKLHTVADIEGVYGLEPGAVKAMKSANAASAAKPKGTK